MTRVEELADRLVAEVGSLRAEVGSLRAERDVMESERDAYRAMLCDVIASAHPNERDHPAMSKQWARARDLLKNGPVIVQCRLCNDTGVFETGNNDLPCERCPKGDTAVFNTVDGQVTGAEIKRRRR